MSFCDSPLSLSDSLSLPFYLFVVIWVFANSWVNGYKGSEGTKEARVFANSWVNGYKGSTLVVATAGSKQSATITDFQSVLRRLQSELMALMKKANDSYYVFCQWFYSCSCSRNYDSIMVSGQECSYCCSWRDSNRLQRFEHPAKDYGSLSFLVVGDWGRRGLHNQSAVALQPIVTLSFVRKSRVSYGCILGFKITTICSDYVKAVCVVVIYASCRSQTNSERASNVYNIGEKEQRCLSTLRYVKSFSRQYASKVVLVCPIKKSKRIMIGCLD